MSFADARREAASGSVRSIVLQLDAPTSSPVDRSSCSCSNLRSWSVSPRDAASPRLPDLKFDLLRRHILLSPLGRWLRPHFHALPTNQPKDTTTSLSLSPDSYWQICNLDLLQRQILRSPLAVPVFEPN
jgi:hypothetical protein